MLLRKCDDDVFDLPVKRTSEKGERKRMELRGWPTPTFLETRILDEDGVSVACTYPNPKHYSSW